MDSSSSSFDLNTNCPKIPKTSQNSVATSPIPFSIQSERILNSSVANVVGSNNSIIINPALQPPERIEYKVQDCIESFTGREDIIHELHEAIESNKAKDEPTILAQTKVITGLGGIGKTETVRKYLRKYKSKYSHALWINAETYASARDCILKIAELTKIIDIRDLEGKFKKDEEIAEEVYNFVCLKPSVIVFDNANSMQNENGEDGISPLLPRTIKTNWVSPAIIITSRNAEWKNYSVLILPGFHDNESYKLLFNQLKFFESEENRSLAGRISQLCDGLPLVIQQVIAVIKTETDDREILSEQPYSMATFLTEYEEGDKNYTNVDPHETARDVLVPNSAFKIFTMTFGKIEERTNGQLAIQCLRIMSILNPDCIPVELLMFILTGEDKAAIAKALKLLMKFNLVGMSNKCFNVHRMVQKVTNEVLKSVRSRQGYTNGLADLIVNTSDRFCKYLQTLSLDHPFKSEIIQNASRLVDWIFKEGCVHVAVNFIYELVVKTENLFDYLTGAHLSPKLLQYHSNAAFRDGIMNVFHRNKISLGQSPPENLKVKLNLARNYTAQGNYSKAEVLYKEVLLKYYISLGADHPDILVIKHNLATNLQRQGKYSQAELMYNEILKTSGIGHRKLLQTKESQCKFSQDQTLYGEVLKLDKSI